MNRLFGQGQTPGPLAGKPLGPLVLNKSSRFYKGLVTAVLDGKHCATTGRAATTYSAGPSGTWAASFPYDVRQDVLTGTLSGWFYSPTAFVGAVDSYLTYLAFDYYNSGGDNCGVGCLLRDDVSTTGGWVGYARINTNTNRSFSTSAPPLGLFHVAISYVNTGACAIYVNAQSKTTFTADTMTTNSQKTFPCGAVGSNVANSVYCLFATHHNYAMSADQVTALWHPSTRWDLVTPVSRRMPMMDAGAAPGTTSQNYLTLLGVGC